MSILMTRVLARRGEKRCREAQTLPVSQSVGQCLYRKKQTNTFFVRFCCCVKWNGFASVALNPMHTFCSLLSWTEREWWMSSGLFLCFIVFFCSGTKNKNKNKDKQNKKKIEPHCRFVIVFGIRSNKTTQHFWGTLDWKQLVSTR